MSRVQAQVQLIVPLLATVFRSLLLLFYFLYDCFPACEYNPSVCPTLLALLQGDYNKLNTITPGFCIVQSYQDSIQRKS
ncbi:hypothetical protein BYT27DRAFT_7190361 [Phlegmacium glaucopus]|nr:hypothetical protein BYT27DRAFT_7190361 [Phlegmacium glaucopus]